ncbi:MAG: TonB-dependent siderophore receptor [Methylobacter sp.]
MVNKKKNVFSGEIATNSGKRISAGILKGIFILTLCHSASALSAENKSQKIQLDLPSGDLASALNSFAEKTGVELSYPASLVAGSKVKQLKGSYSVQEGLNELLRGTGLTYRLTGDNSVTLQKVAVAEPPLSSTPTMKPMTVSSKRNTESQGYSVSNASTGTKTDTPLFDTPISVQVVPKAVIDDQQAIGLENTLKNVSGVAKNWGFGADGNENIYIRGFANGVNSQGNIYRDGVLTPNTPISLANAERVEVLKGPSAMLYGRAQPGGLVNIVTKRPKTDAYYSLQQQFGSYDTYRTLLDATNKITQDGSLAYRINYEHLDTNTFRNNHPNTRDFVAPSLTWKITDKTQLDLDFMYQNVKAVTDSGIPYDLQLSGVIPGKIPLNFSGNEPTDYANKESYTGGVTLTHDFNKDWKVRAKYSTHNQDTAIAQTSSNANADLLGNLQRGFQKTTDNFDNQYGTIDITGHFATGPFKHAVLIGSDYYHSVEKSRSSVNMAAPTINVFNPQYGFTGFDLPLVNGNNVTNDWYGIYAQDQISLWDQWHLLMGGRFDNAKTSRYNLQGIANNHTDTDNFSPRIGLLYQPVSWLGAYVNYVNGFNAFNPGIPLNGSSFEPERSKEMEFGLKGEWLDGRLRSTLAFFELTKTNIKSQLPAPFNNFYSTTGAARSQGIEFDLQGQLTDDWNVIGTYTYMDATVIAGNDSPFSGVGKAGNRLENIPRSAASLWSTYDFSRFGAQGFSAGAGVYLVGDRSGNVDNSFNIPGYARVDSMLKYRHKVGPSNVTVQFNIENLLNKEYMASSNGFGNFVHQTMPGAPRTFLGSVKVEF